MKKKKSLLQLKALLLATSLTVTPPVVTYAKEQESRISDTTWKDKLTEWGKKIVDWSSKVDEKVNENIVNPIKEKASEVEIYKHDSLWLITDMPGTSPEEERNYFFVDQNSPKLKWTFYYDKDGNRVSSNSEEIAKMEIRKMYVSLTDIDTVFLVEEWYDYATCTFTINYVDLDKTKVYETDSDKDYGRFIYIEDIIPEDELKEKYSTDDLIHLLEEINDLSYEIKSEELDLSLKK